MTETPSQVTIEASQAAKLSGDNKFEVLSSLSLDEPKTKVPVEMSIEPESKGDSNGKVNENNQEGQKSAEEAALLAESVPTVQEESKKEASPPPVLSKAKYQDKDIEVPDDATFTFKASKGEVTVPLTELKASYQSKAERDRLYGQYQKEKSTWEADRKTVESRFADFAKGLKENPWEVVSKLSSLYKTNPAEVLPVYLAQAKKTLDELEKLPIEEQKVVFAKMGLDWQAKEVETQKQEIATKESLKADEKYGEELASKHQITQEELDKAWEVLSTTESLHLDKKTKRETIDLLVSYVTQFDRPYTKIEGALGKVDPKLNQNAELKKEIHALISDKDTEEDIVKLVKLYLGDRGAGNGSSSSESAKVNPPKEPERKADSKPTPIKAPPKKEKPKQTIDDDDDIFDLDELVRSYQGR